MRAMPATEVNRLKAFRKKNPRATSPNSLQPKTTYYLNINKLDPSFSESTLGVYTYLPIFYDRSSGVGH